MRNFIVMLFMLMTMYCSSFAPASAQAPPPPGGGAGGEIPGGPIIPPPPPPTYTPPVYTPPAVTPAAPVAQVVTPAPVSQSIQTNLPDTSFKKDALIQTDLVPNRLNPIMEIEGTTGTHTKANFSVLVDEQTLMLVVSEGSEYTSDVPVQGKDVNSFAPGTPEPTEAAKAALNDRMLLNELDTDKTPVASPVVNSAPDATVPETAKAPDATSADSTTTDSSADSSTATGKVTDDTSTTKIIDTTKYKSNKKTVMQKLKQVFRYLGIGKSNKPESKAIKALPSTQPPPAAQVVKAVVVPYVANYKSTVALPLPSRTFELKKGCLVIKGKEPVKVNVAGREVYVQYGATCVIATDSKQVKVLALDERRGKSILVVDANRDQPVRLAAGELIRFDDAGVSRIYFDDKEKSNVRNRHIMLRYATHNHPLVWSMVRGKSAYANHKAMRDYHKTVASLVMVDARSRALRGVPRQNPPKHGTKYMYDHLITK